jgi:hypothetical protein
MLSSGLPLSLDPADLAPEDRARAVAAILATGILRLRQPALPPAAPPPDTPENLSESIANRLADAGETSVTVSAG